MSSASIDALLIGSGLTRSSNLDALLQKIGETVSTTLDAILFALTGYAFGEQSPNQGEGAESWATWSDGDGGLPVITGDADWGKIELGENDVGHSAVKDLGSGLSRTLTVTRDRYGTGSGNINTYIRGQAGTFLQDAASPSWAAYSNPIVEAWQYVQIKIERSE